MTALIIVAIIDVSNTYTAPNSSTYKNAQVDSPTPTSEAIVLLFLLELIPLPI